LVIVEVIQGGPGQKAGLKSGDKIMEVNGEKLRGLSTDEVINNNGLRVRVQVKYYKSIKYIDVYHDIYPIGVDFE
jgi:C-terminal processing protease CtpA/Prc